MIVLILLIYYIIIRIFTYNKNIYTSHIYLDYNATTPPATSAIVEYTKHVYCGNASGIYANKAREILYKTRNLILKCADLDPMEYFVIFTSGASESINSFINAIMLSDPEYHAQSSTYEHVTTLQCLNKYRERVTYVKPNRHGYVHASQFNDTTASKMLISLIMTHNELGITNFIDKCNLPPDCIYHVDAVQAFGKHPLVKADAYSISFHKIYGFPGIGALIVHNSLYSLLKQHPNICGHQNYNLRGGTENVALIASVYGALKYAFNRRPYKIIRMRDMISYILHRICEYGIPIIEYDRYLIDNRKQTTSNVELCVIARPPNVVNTLALTAINKCRYRIQRYLLQKNIIVGTGSACGRSNTLTSIDVPSILIPGMIRVSIGDSTTYQECNRFVSIYIEAVSM